MIEESQRRRQKDFTVDKNLRFTTTVTFFVTVVGMAVSAAFYVSRMTAADVALRSEMQEMRATVDRTVSRLQTYIDRFGDVHEVMEGMTDELHHDLLDIREEWAARFGERLP